MCDVFEDNPELVEPRDRLFQLIDRTPNLDWLLLTKRPQNIRKLWDWGWYDDQFTWPNIWLGVSVEDQPTADERIPVLTQIPAKVRFISAEPLLGPVDFSQWIFCSVCGKYGDTVHSNHPDGHSTLHWIIVGGESGNNARPMHPDWVNRVVDHTSIADVPVFFKQWGEWCPQYQYSGVQSYGKPHAMWPDGTVKEEYSVFDGDKGFVVMRKTGKKKAGNTLRGLQYMDFPHDE
jgi:protein gp37